MPAPPATHHLAGGHGPLYAGVGELAGDDDGLASGDGGGVGVGLDDAIPDVPAAVVRAEAATLDDAGGVGATGTPQAHRSSDAATVRVARPTNRHRVTGPRRFTARGCWRETTDSAVGQPPADGGTVQAGARSPTEHTRTPPIEGPDRPKTRRWAGS